MNFRNLLNANFVHNVLNIILIILTWYISRDWGQAIDSLMKLDWADVTNQANAANIANVLLIIKMLMNIFRDGVTGLYKVQPPVHK